jgi:hypothetical protein
MVKKFLIGSAAVAQRRRTRLAHHIGYQDRCRSARDADFPPVFQDMVCFDLPL